MKNRALLILALALAGARGVAAQAYPADPKIARFATCPLERGGAIVDCQIAYRTFGALSASRDNAVLYTTWFLGRTRDGVGFYIGGPAALIDTTRFYVIAVDALGNAESASPSTSRTQGGERFPHFTMRDVVASQHRLLTESLSLSRLHAVVGASMGGMQAVQWSVQYPDFAGRIVAIVPTPRTAAYDRILWGTELRAIEMAERAGAPRDSLLDVLEGIQTLALQTPALVNRTAADSANTIVTRASASFRARFNPWNWASQLRAMIAHDVGAPYGGSLETASQRVRARALLIYAVQDHMVTPATIRDWAKWTGAETLEMTGECGHLATGCEREQVRPRVVEFLARR
ncbi:MAG: alpha/beta fold hydrolase [Gemmatimonadaceae bacterium]|nr:alpha/beta fold hydrolase [Gemmatimonadaceae bacterium]